MQAEYQPEVTRTETDKQRGGQQLEPQLDRRTQTTESPGGWKIKLARPRSLRRGAGSRRQVGSMGTQGLVGVATHSSTLIRGQHHPKDKGPEGSLTVHLSAPSMHACCKQQGADRDPQYIKHR